MEEVYRLIIKDGFKLLQSQKNYRQITIINKLNTLGYEWKEDIFKENTKDDFLVEIVLENNKQTHQNDGFRFHKDGRLSTSEKVAFLATAQKEIIEFGVTLNSFSSYFFNRKRKEFKDPIFDLLNKGVLLKCYLLDPNCNAARFYFEDRKSILLDDKGEEKINNSIKKLLALKEEIKSMNIKGGIEIYTYKRIPSNYFLSIDSTEENGKMMASHYLYGTRRAECPVVEFTKKDNPSLFNLYNDSLSNLIRKAKLIE